jgi:preprotein translocase subunit SecD
MEFTEKNIMHQIAFVTDGTVITIHKIRAAVTDGEIQITRCTDNACQVLYLRLKEKVSKK